MKRLAWLLLLLTWPAAVQAREFALDIGSALLTAQNAAGDVLAHDRVLAHLLVRTGVEVAPHWQAEVQWQTGAQDNGVFAGSAQHSLTTHWLSAGVRRDWRVRDWLRPYARGGLGLTHEAIELQTGMSRFEDAFWTPHAAGSVGLDLLLPPGFFAPRGKGTFTVGLTWEVGYAHALGHDVVAEQQVRPDPQLTQRPLDLGTLALSGWLQRIALTVRL